jgi:hypothetical protein
MQRPQFPDEVDDWMSEYGWFPGRNIGERALRLVSTVRQQYAEEGLQLASVPSAEAFIRSYGGLRVLIDYSIITQSSLRYLSTPERQRT